MLEQHEIQVIYIENMVYKLFFWDCTRKKQIYLLHRSGWWKNKLKLISDSGSNFYCHLVPSLLKMSPFTSKPELLRSRWNRQKPFWDITSTGRLCYFMEGCARFHSFHGCHLLQNTDLLTAVAVTCYAQSKGDCRQCQSFQLFIQDTWNRCQTKVEKVC